MKKIHYVCRGNVYRSRMAEAYTKSLVLDDDYVVDSSGIQAELAFNGDVDPVAVEELKKDGINHLLTKTWKQTTQSMLDHADIIVILSQSVYKDIQNRYTLNEAKTVVLDVPDIDGVYKKIKINVNNLLKDLNGA